MARKERKEGNKKIQLQKLDRKEKEKKRQAWKSLKKKMISKKKKAGLELLKKNVVE